MSICLVIYSLPTQAADLVDVLPLHSSMIMVHIDDGYVRHHELGETRETEWVIGTSLDISAAILTGSYAISSPDDPAYQTALMPNAVHRKSKGTDFTWLCQGWNGNCVNTDPDHSKEHWLYLQLPSPMENGKSYQIDFPGLTDIDPITILYDENQHRSEAIHVNQLGYDPLAGEKYGYVYHWMGDAGDLDLSAWDGNAFHLVDTLTGAIAYSGSLTFRKTATNQEFARIDQAPPYANLVGAEVYDCDFSAFMQSGTYRLCVEGIGCSFPFDISGAVYKEPLSAVLNGLYQQRSGIATTAAYTSQPRPVPHHPALTPGFAGKLMYSSVRYPDFGDGDGSMDDKAAIDAGILGPIESWGWYQDAGDWDSYFLHTEVPMSLLWLQEMGMSRFTDGQFMLPESSNGLPDLLDEALWLPRFHHRLRHEMIAKGYSTGGIGGGRIFGDLWGGDELLDGTTIGSWQDTSRTWVCTGADPFMSYQYAGLAAHIAYLLSELGMTDPDNIDWQTEATAAYLWASQNTLVQDTVLFGLPMTHVRLFAAANLYRLTGDTSYQNQFIADFGQVPANVIMTSELLFGMATYAETEGIFPLEASTYADVLAKIESESDFVLLDFRDTRACRWGGNYYFPFLVGQPSTPFVQAGIVAHHILRDSKPQKAQQYQDALFSTADYFLGNNPLNMTWVTGVGERHPEEILNLDSWYLGGDTPRFGIVPYGPWEAESDFGPLGPWNHMWALETIYPSDRNLWPPHERWFNQRTAAFGAEYTIHQNLAPSILTYGYLYAIGSGEAPTAIDPNFSSSDHIDLYPNPARTEVQIHLKQAEQIRSVSLLSIDGQLLHQQAWENGLINVEAFPPGIYILSIEKEIGETMHGKLIISR